MASHSAQISRALVDGGREARRQMLALSAAWEELRSSAITDSFLRIFDGYAPDEALADDDPQEDQAPEGAD